MTTARAKRRARKANYAGIVKPITPWWAALVGLILIGCTRYRRNIAHRSAPFSLDEPPVVA